jgi:Nucleotidyl transferase AbiEii toxin, Type IV TA system
VEPRHRTIAEIALAAAGSYGLALAGGYAVRAHGLGSRPSGDVDLFTDWQRRADFPAATDTVISALEKRGYTVNVAVRGDTFARLLVHVPGGADAEPEKVELAADWRAHPPVLLAVGPVLHPDDAVANKMCALYGRALARDFLDVYAAVASGRYTQERMLELAANADTGFDPVMFADALGALAQITDAAFAEYGTSPEETALLRQRFARWRAGLLKK